MPIRTSRGRAAVFRQTWGRPLRSPRNLMVTVLAMAVLAASVGWLSADGDGDEDVRGAASDEITTSDPGPGTRVDRRERFDDPGLGREVPDSTGLPTTAPPPTAPPTTEPPPTAPTPADVYRDTDLGAEPEEDGFGAPQQADEPNGGTPPAEQPPAEQSQADEPAGDGLRVDQQPVPPAPQLPAPPPPAQSPAPQSPAPQSPAPQPPDDSVDVAQEPPAILATPSPTPESRGPGEPERAAEGCARVFVLAVPGTNEINEAADPRVPVGMLANVTKPISRAYGPRQVRVHYLPYPASRLGPFPNPQSLARGIDLSTATLRNVAADCPDTVFALLGYSQGAYVAGDVAAAIGSGTGPVPAQRVLRVGLIADPARPPAAKAPSVPPNVPGQGVFSPRPAGFGALAPRVMEVCAPGDPVCDTSQTGLDLRAITEAFRTGVHTGYATLVVDPRTGTTATQWVTRQHRIAIDRALGRQRRAGPERCPPRTDPPRCRPGSTRPDASEPSTTTPPPGSSSDPRAPDADTAAPAPPIGPGQQPPRAAAGDVRPVAHWRERFDRAEDEFYQENVELSRSSNSWDYYDLAYGVDGYTSMFEATGERRYADRALELTTNMVDQARPVAGDFLGWTSQRADTRGEEVPLFESYCWRYVTRLLLALRQSPLYEDPGYRQQYDRLLEFAEVNMFDKWYSRGVEEHMYRNRTHMASHWAYIAAQLSMLTTDEARRARYQEVFTAINRGMPGGNSLRDQLQLVGPAYLWSARWGERGGEQDVAHGNNMISYIVAAHDIGVEWTDEDMDRFVGTLNGILDAGGEVDTVDGQGSGNGWLSDGFVKLGRYDPAMQRRLEDHDTQTPQYFAAMAVNARILTQGAGNSSGDPPPNPDPGSSEPGLPDAGAPAGTGAPTGSRRTPRSSADSAPRSSAVATPHPLVRRLRRRWRLNRCDWNAARHGHCPQHPDRTALRGTGSRRAAAAT